MRKSLHATVAYTQYRARAQALFVFSDIKNSIKTRRNFIFISFRFHVKATLDPNWSRKKNHFNLKVLFYRKLWSLWICLTRITFRIIFRKYKVKAILSPLFRLKPLKGYNKETKKEIPHCSFDLLFIWFTFPCLR